MCCLTCEYSCQGTGFIEGTKSEWSCSWGKCCTISGWKDSTPGMKQEGLSHLATFIMSVRSQDHPFELSGDMSTRPQKRPSRGELHLNGFIRMTREIPNSPAELPPKPPALWIQIKAQTSSQVCGVVRCGACHYSCDFHPYLSAVDLPNLVDPLIPFLGL